MKRMRFFSLLLILCGMLGLALPVGAAEVDCDAVYCFSSGDFSDEEPIAGIFITSLPDPASGTVLLGSRVLRAGDILTARQLEETVFQPLLTETDQEALMSYLPIYADRVEAQAVMSITVFGKKDEAPVAEDSAVETYKNLPNEALLKVKDPEGEALTFTVTRQPKKGEVVIREDGSFVYTPKKNKVGVDSFTYTAADPAGNVSREATVTVTIMKPTDSSQYTDTEGTGCRFAAEWMKNTGIFISESIGGNSCFQPGKEVTRGEFLTMLAGALDMEPDEGAVYTGFTDDCADWLKPYLAAAMRSGLTVGWPEADTFGADEPITGAEAAVLLNNALDLNPEAVDAELDEAVPVWAQDAMTALELSGISIDWENNLTRADAAVLLYQAARLDQ